VSLTVVYAQLTRHVVAAIDETAVRTAPQPVEQIVGSVLPLRRTVLRTGAAQAEQLDVPVPADQLGTALADPAAGVLTNPMAYGIGSGSALEPLSPWSAGAEPVALKSTGVTVTLERTSKGLATPVLVVIARPGATLVLSGQVFAERKVVTIGVELPPGPYAVLTLATGWHGRLDGLSLP